MARTILLRLTDIRDAIQGITGLTAGASYEVFVQDWGMQRAVERGLEIMSEASRHIPDDRKASAPEVPWRQRADNSLVWNIVLEHLPRLGQAVDKLIQAAVVEKQQ